VRLRRFAKGDSRDYAPISLIWLLFRFSARLERLKRFARGDKRPYASMAPIKFP